MLTLSWTRLEPGIRTPDLQAGIEARTHDPLWMLARQWQFGEFRAEDAGTPIAARVVTKSQEIDRYVAGGQTRSFACAEAPLEAVVEREPATARGPDFRLRVRAGMHLQRMLERIGHSDVAAALLNVHTFTEADLDEFPNDEDAGFVRLMLGRAVDGARALKALLAASPGIPKVFASIAATTIKPVLKDWRSRYEPRLAPASEGTAWDPERLEYRFALQVASDGLDLSLDAPEYMGGRLDWDAYVLRELGPAPSPGPVVHEQRIVPTAVTFAGMPDPRFWAFENNLVDFGEATAGPADVGRMLLAEFAFSWGNDWFQIPVALATGTLTRCELEVTDTFGVVTRVEHFSHQDPWAKWRMFSLSREQAQAPTDQLLLAPTLASSLQGQAVESVALVRDEGANLAWAIEQTVPDHQGRAKPRTDTSAPLPASDGSPRHELMSPVQTNWIALVAVRDQVDGPRMLTRAGVIEDEGETSVASGVLLGDAPGFRIYEEELPRSGIKLERAVQVARWYDGRRVTWVTREKRPGGGEIASGLAFDELLR